MMRKGTAVTRFPNETAEDGYKIISLTEHGKSANALTVPISHSGKPVVDFAANTFQNHSALRELTIQPNIHWLYDDMLTGCEELRYLYLENSIPEQTAVGEHLLSGVSLQIIVPSGARDSYTRSYRWQKYEPWILEKQS